MSEQTIIHGDNIKALKAFPDNNFDSIVTDPPYGLKFMNKHWDHEVPSMELWREALRVLKPGGHVLSFGGTRTYHRMVVNIEDAGFEIRDMIQWIYATGFPKNHDINKHANGQICNCDVRDKKKSEHDMRQMPKTDLSTKIDPSDKQGEILQPRVSKQNLHSPMQGASAGKIIENGEKPGMEGGCNNLQKEGELCKCKICSSARMGPANDEEGWIYNGTSPNNGKNVRQASFEKGSGSSQGSQPNEQPSDEFGTLSDEWNPQNNGAWPNCDRCGKPIFPRGIGTALKPANEPICMARKPFKGSIIENIKKWGTGGINIHESRIDFADEADRQEAVEKNQHEDFKSGRRENRIFGESMLERDNYNAEGRWPANILFDEQAAQLLDEQDSASRFFYVAKPSRYERDKGLGHLEKRKVNDGRETEIDNPFQRGESLRANTHVTVKPITLMRYLIKLITPKNGLVLDMFNGSGSTGIACKLEHMNYVGIDNDAESCEISRARLAAWNPELYTPQTLF